MSPSFRRVTVYLLTLTVSHNTGQALSRGLATVTTIWATECRWFPTSWQSDGSPLFSSSGSGIRTRDLVVMSHASYQAAPPHIEFPAGPGSSIDPAGNARGVRIAQATGRQAPCGGHSIGCNLWVNTKQVEFLTDRRFNGL